MHSSHQAYLTHAASVHCWFVLQVLNTAPRPQLPGEVLPDPPIPDEITPLVRRFPQNQALMCLQARQQMQRGKFEEALQTVAPFLGGTNGTALSRWALHLTVHVHWLSGELNEVLFYTPILKLPDVFRPLLTALREQ